MKRQRIVIDRKIMLGKPVIAGTRITVEQILRLLAQGQTSKEIRKNFPHLEKKDIEAAIKYAYEVISGEEIYLSHEKDFRKIRQVYR